MSCEPRLADNTRNQKLSRGRTGAGDSEAAGARELIEAVTVFRDHSRPRRVTVEITGRLNALLGEQAYPNRARGVWGKMVAKERSISPRGFPQELVYLFDVA
jgi:hypothetical protein